MGVSRTIRTDRLELRPFAVSDAAAILDYSQDPAWAEYQQTAPRSEREAERVLAALLLRDWEREPAWAMTRSGVVIGLVTLAFSEGHRLVLLGFGIHRDHRGLRLTEEAVRAVLGEAFAMHPELVRVTAHTDARNHRSRRLLERIGFSHEGTLRLGGVTAKGELADAAIYGILRSDREAPARARPAGPTRRRSRRP